MTPEEIQAEANAKERYKEIQAMPKGQAKAEAFLALGGYCIGHGLNADAAYAMREALCGVSWSEPGDARALLDEAYNGLRQLAGSRDECAWEVASQAVADFDTFNRDRR